MRLGRGELRSDERLIAALTQWFAAHARDLPWRDAAHGSRDPYRVLVSEIMLQQTQVSRAAERFPVFMARFPTVAALAAADEDEVLALWSGMGYYRRARLLHAAARAVAAEHGGTMPRTLEALRSLPGVGRYTVGAIASIAYDAPAAIVDGNVVRVLLRINGREGAADDRETVSWCWAQAARLAERAAAMAAEAGAGAVSDAGSAPRGPGAFNESLMELGATVCTPRGPRCDSCPVATFCIARRDGLQGEIPRPKTPPQRKRVHLAAVVVRDRAGRVLVEQRPARGLWGRMWQVPTVEIGESATAAEVLSRLFATLPGATVRSTRKTAERTVQTTHREVLITIYEATPPRVEGEMLAPPPTHAAGSRRWATPEDLAGLGFANWQREIVKPTAT